MDQPVRPRPPGQRTLPYLAAGLVATSIVAVAGEPYRGWLMVAILVSTVRSGLLARDRASGRGPVWWMTVGALVQVPAYVLWYPAELQLSLDLGSPSITDALFLGGYAAHLMAFVRLIGADVRRQRWTELHETLIVAVGIGLVAGVGFVLPYLQDESLSWPGRLVAVSYGAVDLLLLGALVRLAVQRSLSSAGGLLLAGWIAAQMAADTVYSVASLRGTFTFESPAIVLYCASFVFLGAVLRHGVIDASALARDEHARSTVVTQRYALMLASALVAPVLLVGIGARDGSIEVLTVGISSTVLFVLVLARVRQLMVDVEEHRRIQVRLTEAVEVQRVQAEENRELLVSLRERQMLAERLSRIQRKISTRAPLQEVLDAITQGAAELLHDQVAALRLLDDEDPETMLMVSSVGVPDEMVSRLHRLPVDSGVGGRAIVTNRLCIQADYASWDDAIESFAATGLRTAMGAPVHMNDRPIGSLVVATHRPDRTYSAAEQDALISFTRHVSIALNDARSVRAVNEALEHAVYQAMHDELTGLANRACFYDRAEQALRVARRTGGATAVLLFDLDRFKDINDTLGHRYGDRVLCAVGPRISPLLRECDSLARLGGDEFCVLLPDVGSVDDAMQVAHRIAVALEAPLAVDGITLAVAASCGVAIAPAHGDTADVLLQRADVAMYVAKRGHVTVAAYEDVLDRNTTERLELLADLRAPEIADQLELHYQPQVDLRTGAATGVEALVRWRHPQRGLIGPDGFIPIAEETGMIHAITTWVLDAALAQLRDWRRGNVVPGDFTMAVNLSRHSLLDERFAVEVVTGLDRFGVPPGALVLEVTETSIMSDPGRASRLLATLADTGVRFAIDDFGTGYSSLAALKGLPVHHLKIDKSFVSCMHEDESDATIVRSVVDLGHTLGLRTIAEGVECDDARRILVDLGCDTAQGYLFARPMPADAFPGWIADRTRMPVHSG